MKYFKYSKFMKEFNAESCLNDALIYLLFFMQHIFSSLLHMYIPFPRGNGIEIAKIHWRNITIFFSRITLPKSTKPCKSILTSKTQRMDLVVLLPVCTVFRPFLTNHYFGCHQMYHRVLFNTNQGKLYIY